MKVLITGGSGLVGNGIKENIYKYPDYEFIFLSSKDCNLLNKDEVEITFHKIKPDYVCHMAANVGGLYKNMTQKVQMLEDNIIINFNVLNVCHKLNIKKLVSCLSTCIFPDNVTYPINESMLHDGPPHYSNDSYAYAKRLLEIQSRAYNEQYGDNFICVIPTNIYGSYDNFHLQNAHVIPALIHQCYLSKKESKPFVVKGSGKPLRQFIYAKDLGDLILWTLFNYNEKDNLILSVDEEDEVSISDIASYIAEEFNYKESMIYDTSFSDGQYKKTASNKKLRSFLPNYQFTKPKDGISNTIKWFIQNYQNVRK